MDSYTRQELLWILLLSRGLGVFKLMWTSNNLKRRCYRLSKKRLPGKLNAEAGNEESERTLEAFHDPRSSGSSFKERHY